MSGAAGSKIESRSPPSPWRRRRWTQAPRKIDGPAVPWTRTAQQLEQPSVSADVRSKYEQTLVARRTSYAFDRWFSTMIRVAWTRLGGERGQMSHTGDPLVFVPAGEHTTVAPWDGLN